MQAASDIFLGWIHVKEVSTASRATATSPALGLEGVRRHRHDQGRAGLEIYAQTAAGRSRAHTLAPATASRSPSYLGKNDVFDRPSRSSRSPTPTRTTRTTRPSCRRHATAGFRPRRASRRRWRSPPVVRSVVARRCRLGVVLVVQALFVVSYVGALHAPRPHDLPFGVVGPPALADAVGTRFSLRTTSTPTKLRRGGDRPSQAVRRARHERVRNDAARRAAASNSTAIALTTAFTAAAAAAGGSLTVVQVHALPSGDRSGSVPFLVVMALVIGGYLSATIATTVPGPATHGRRRPAILAGVAVIGSFVTDLVAGP